MNKSFLEARKFSHVLPRSANPTLWPPRSLVKKEKSDYLTTYPLLTLTRKATNSLPTTFVVLFIIVTIVSTTCYWNLLICLQWPFTQYLPPRLLPPFLCSSLSNPRPEWKKSMNNIDRLNVFIFVPNGRFCSTVVCWFPLSGLDGCSSWFCGRVKRSFAAGWFDGNRPGWERPVNSFWGAGKSSLIRATVASGWTFSTDGFGTGA